MEERLKERYRLGDAISSGFFGKVYEGWRIKDELPVAVKKVPGIRATDWIDVGDDKRRIPVEVYCLLKLSDVENVVRIYDYCESSNSYFVVMERPKGYRDLHDVLKWKNVDGFGTCELDEEDSVRIAFRNIVETVVRCQIENGIFHADIKEDNILVNPKEGSIKLVDFGNSKLLSHPEEIFTGWYGIEDYAPPEWFETGFYDAENATVWSLGVLLYSMMHGGRVPFRGESEIVERSLPKFRRSDDLSDGCKDLIRKCLTRDELRRIRLNEILSHPWFSSS